MISRLIFFCLLLVLGALALLKLAPPIMAAKDSPVVPGPLTMAASPVPLRADAPGEMRLGRLHFIAAWHLTSPNPAFGGLSSLAVERDGGLLALSDTGVLIGLGRPPLPGRRRFVAPLPLRAIEKDWPRWQFDSESMAHDPATGRHWAGFELAHRICRYAPGFARVEGCRTWPEMKPWPDTGGAEAMARLPDGRFLLIAEMGDSADGRGSDALLFAADPVDPATPAPARLSYRPPQGYRPTDAVALDAQRLLVLNRRLTLYDGFTAVLSLVDLRGARHGGVLEGKPLAWFAPPVLADNFEALALERRAGRTLLWVLSDDNHKFFQRTLLLQFALPDDL